MRFIASFADQIIASVESVCVEFSYSGLLEGSLASATNHHYMPAIEERRDLIEAGRLKGFYCFEPELMNEREFWESDNRIDGKCLKDNSVKAKLTVSEDAGQYSIVLEWYLSTRELIEAPLPSLVQQAARKLKYKDIKQYCKFHDWDELS